MNEDDRADRASNEKEMELPGRSFRFGIPTAADVRDPQYLEAMLSEKFRDEFGFGWMPLSTVFVHNHVLAALGDGGDDPGKVHQILAEDENTPVPAVTERTAELLNPPYILSVYLGSLNHTKSRLTKFFPILGHLMVPMTVSINFPIDTALPVTLEKQNGDERIYTFTPYKLLTAQLSRIEDQLQEAILENDPAAAVRGLWRVARREESDPVNELITSLLPVPDASIKKELALTVGSEAYRLQKLHEAITAGSNLSLDFSGRLIDITYKIAHGSFRQTCPVELLTNPDTLNQVALFSRVRMRDRATQFLLTTGALVVNGIRVTRDESGKVFADTQPPLWFVNLLGEPVSFGEGIVLPDGWALEERHLIDQYRTLAEEETLAIPPRGVVKELFSRYCGFERTAGRTTDEHRVDLLRYTLINPPDDGF